MDAVRNEIQKLDAAIRKDTDELKTIVSRLAKANSVLAQIGNLEAQYQDFGEKALDDVTDLGLTLDALVDLRVDRSPLNGMVTALQAEQQAVRNRLDESNPDSLPSQKTRFIEELGQLQSTLEGPQRDQEAYKTNLNEWTLRRGALIGNAETVETLEYYRAAKSALALLPAQLGELRKKRSELVKKIFGEIATLAQVYSDLYRPVQRFIDEHELVTKRFDLSFEVAIRPQSFELGFFDKVKRNISGSFCGDEEATAQLMRALMGKYDFSDADDVGSFVNEMADRLSRNYQIEEKTAVSVSSQLKKGHTIEELYHFIFALEYLVPQYALRMTGKDLMQLSPGERGALLLMFYLLVDKDDIPLIVDQPEENLDNQTVYTMLGACIKEAKKRRQIVIVTHNPNLAVACDAEQIICASHSSLDDERISYVSGAIENPKINQCLLDILEGTRPAFENREAKYLHPD
jgi:predicted ATPase